MLAGQLAPDLKTVADFRKDNGKAIGEVCREFVALCRKLDLLVAASVAIDRSMFKAASTSTMLACSTLIKIISGVGNEDLTAVCSGPARRRTKGDRNLG